MLSGACGLGFAGCAERGIGPTFRYQDMGIRTGNGASNLQDGATGLLRSFLFFLIHANEGTMESPYQVATWPSVEHSCATFAQLGAPVVPMENWRAIPVILSLMPGRTESPQPVSKARRLWSMD